MDDTMLMLISFDGTVTTTSLNKKDVFCVEVFVVVVVAFPVVVVVLLALFASNRAAAFDDNMVSYLLYRLSLEVHFGKSVLRS